VARTMAVPCRRDLACYRNDGHDGDCMYPTADTKPVPTALFGRLRMPIRCWAFGEVDMPRLARALRNAKPCGDPNCADLHLTWCDNEVAAIAREYAALEEPTE